MRKRQHHAPAGKGLQRDSVLGTLVDAWNVAFGKTSTLRKEKMLHAAHAARLMIDRPPLLQDPPAAPPARAASLKNPGAADASWQSRRLSSPVKILIVEDDPQTLNVLAMVFKDFDCEVFEANSGEMALEYVRRHVPDVILTDFQLPGCNGFELIRKLRQYEALSSTPVIMITGSPKADTLAECMRLETVAYLRKPAKRAALLGVVQKELGGRLPPKAQPPNDGESGPDRPEGADRAPEDSPEPPPQRYPEPAADSPSYEDSFLEQRSKIDVQTLTDHGAEAVKLIEIRENQVSDIYVASEAEAAPMIKLVNGIIGLAVEKRASDIHVEPQENHVRARLRIDGELVGGVELPAVMAPSIAARIKIMASLDIAERRIPQDGRFRMQLEDGSKVEFRVSTLPCKYGEKIVMRILGRSKIQGNLAALKLPARDEEILNSALESPNGLILVTGPTGSGKTTTLYTMIAKLNTPNRNITTVEDPIEYELPGISQVAVNNAVGLTFEKALRSFLRQDPDIMLVGEIRDIETADIAMKASITGHLVLSTLHTNDAVTTISRLSNMGLPSYMISAALRVVVAQRLLRVLCPHCKANAPLSDDERRLLTQEENLRIATAFRGVGCPRCDGSGYSGRVPVLEVLPIRTPAMHELIMNGASADALQALALQEGMKTLRDGAIHLLERGETSLSEALKILVVE